MDWPEEFDVLLFPGVFVQILFGARPQKKKQPKKQNKKPLTKTTTKTNKQTNKSKQNKQKTKTKQNKTKIQRPKYLNFEHNVVHLKERFSAARRSMDRENKRRRQKEKKQENAHGRKEEPSTQTHTAHISHRLVGLVVKAPAPGAEHPGFESRLRRDFSGSSHTSDLKIDTPVATLSGAWRCRVSAGTDRLGVSIL